MDLPPPFGLTNLPAAAHNINRSYSALAAAGEARLLAGEMPSQDQLRAMGMSESEALGMLAFYAAEDNAEDGKIAVQTALELEKSVKPKPYLFNRPSYKKGQVEQVWENALKNSPQPGKVIDPSGEEIFWDRSKPRKGQWDMGHIPGQKYSEKHKEYIEGRMTKAEFLAWYHDPANYRPELPKTNRSHKYE